jgi:hypothetical protein
MDHFTERQTQKYKTDRQAKGGAGRQIDKQMKREEDRQTSRWRGR